MSKMKNSRGGGRKGNNSKGERVSGSSSHPMCALCPVQGGAMKQTPEGTWVHIVCAMYVPEVLFLDDVAMEPVGSINENMILPNLTGIARYDMK